MLSHVDVDDSVYDNLAMLLLWGIMLLFIFISVLWVFAIFCWLLLVM